MLRIKSSSIKIDQVFLLGLFALFASTAILVVIVGSMQYRDITDTISQNHEFRSSSSYFREKLRQNNEIDEISLTSIQECPALALKQTVNGQDYTTYIYYYDGWVRELLVSADSVFSISAGQPVMEASGLDLTLISPTLLSITMTDSANVPSSFYISVQHALEKEA